ncbi:MAG: fibronectin type III domain-containing protein [Candidatus Vogelbacteria bacterium]|nr:fibronectin type III domain-containing protein [Candidatus Vogelbacteria bacterium]
MIKKKLASALLLLSMVGGVAVPAISFADTTVTATSSLQARLELITKLIQQLQVLQEQLKQLQAQEKEAQSGLKEDVKEFVSDIKEGETGDDVKVLQAVLALYPDVYPEGLVTGAYAKKTAAAVLRLQKKFGVKETDRIDKETRDLLNKLLKDNPVAFENIAEGGRVPCAIVPPGHLIAPGWLRKHRGVKPIVSVCQIIPPGIREKLGEGTSTPPVRENEAPVISMINSSTTYNGATITWKTDQSATSKVYYGLLSPIDINATSTLNTGNGYFTRDHSVTLSSLTASTTYYFVVESKNEDNKTARSEQMTFVTSSAPVTPDTTAPVVSVVSSTAATSTAAVSWMTNESATSKIYFGTMAPFDPSAMTTSTMMDGAFVTSHSLALSGLTASTTYYFVVESKDASNNVGTSSQVMFATLPIAMDTTPPVITSVSSVVSSSTATITWMTNEAASSKVYYSLSSSVDVTASTTLAMADTSLVTSHSINLSGLGSAATYHFVVESKDASNNIATSSEATFVTSSSGY